MGNHVHPLPLPPELPPERVWVPVSTQAEALAARDALYQAITGTGAAPPLPDQDLC